ncbi:CaiB/BaiF CoA transferase family protein [Nakamurella lactea]|uniref:CaiB/BaiF CoA transferase family protein n=1 Tax=Nakamurella lactea TaxID=459515 RepID=UPI0013770F86|nr:CoA transferase [Nakamurella lactea]
MTKVNYLESAPEPPLTTNSVGTDQRRPAAELPLAGIRVVDLTVVWSGPGATALLGDLGAEVIRLEGNNRMSRQASARVTRESFRASGYHGGTYPDRTPEPRPYDRTALFAWHARNKLSACCNLETPEGRQAALDLLAVSDVLVENNSNGTLEKLGLGHELLLQHNPRLVIARMPPMGMTGPMSNYLGYGPNFNSLVGIAAMDGYEGEPPDSAGENYHMDEAAPAGLAFAVLAALWDRENTGSGGLIEFSQAEAVMAEVGEFVIDAQLNDRAPAIRGNTDPHLLQDVFETARDDRWVVLSIRDDRDWAALTDAMAGLGEPDPADRRVLTDGNSAEGRRLHSRRLRDEIARWVRTRTADQVVEQLQAVGVPAGEVMAEDRLLADEHLAAREWFVSRSHPAVGRHRFPGHPWRADGFDLAFGRPLPSFGEDNDYVYTEVLGYPAERYQDLKRRKLVTDEQFA